MNFQVFVRFAAILVASTGWIVCAKQEMERKVIHMTVRHREVFEVTDSTGDDEDDELVFRRLAPIQPEVIYHEVDYLGKYDLFIFV